MYETDMRDHMTQLSKWKCIPVYKYKCVCTKEYVSFDLICYTEQCSCNMEGNLHETRCSVHDMYGILKKKNSLIIYNSLSILQTKKI